MNKIIKTASKALAAATTFATLGAGKAMALTISSVEEGMNLAKTSDMPTNLTGTGGVIDNVTSTILAVLGFLAVIMLIIGGVKYATSAGDAKAVTDAKNTILYALIGLVIAILSYSIVKFVIGIL
ncbi:hypothetical protein IJG96_01600 [Candidatus Saccharibacteria bacterium]|nr:hypothetical protein [Candidatus Saccharibacteria bacterium]